MSISNLHTTIDYKELIKFQANQPNSQNYVKKQKDIKIKTYTKIKTK